MSEDEIIAKFLNELASILETTELQYDHVLEGKNRVRKISPYITIRTFASRLRERAEELEKGV